MLKVVCYGVRPNEVPYFEKLNKYQYELSLVEALLNDDNVDAAAGGTQLFCVGIARQIATTYKKWRRMA